VRQFTLIILRDDVIEGLVRKAKPEVRKIDAREKTSTAAGVVLEGAVVVRYVEAQRSNGVEHADLDAKLELMVALSSTCSTHKDITGSSREVGDMNYIHCYGIVYQAQI
jgi:esterase/lipase superfamily enzyme